MRNNIRHLLTLIQQWQHSMCYGRATHSLLVGSIPIYAIHI